LQTWLTTHSVRKVCDRLPYQFPGTLVTKAKT
jgi:hypothetical protein